MVVRLAALKKSVLNDFECSMVVGAIQADLSISETDLLGFSHTSISRVYRECQKKKRANIQ